MARPTKYKEEWDDEYEMQSFLCDLDNGALSTMLGVEIENVSRERVIPKEHGYKYSRARLDILVEDVGGNYHIIEVKHVDGNNILTNSHGVTQLLFYEAMLSQAEGIEAKTLNLVTNCFDDTLKGIVARNNLNVRLIRLHKDHLEVIKSLIKKDGSKTWKPKCKRE